MADQDTFSVVVPVRNGAGWIRNCLGSIAQLDPRPDEVIVVDGSSDDGTAELAPAVRAFLACLPGKVRQALIMTEYQGLGAREIAERLDISPAEAESRVREGREMLREALSDWCHWAAEREP